MLMFECRIGKKECVVLLLESQSTVSRKKKETKSTIVQIQSGLIGLKVNRKKETPEMQEKMEKIQQYPFLSFLLMIAMVVEWTPYNIPPFVFLLSLNAMLSCCKEIPPFKSSSMMSSCIARTFASARPPAIVNCSWQKIKRMMTLTSVKSFTTHSNFCSHALDHKLPPLPWYVAMLTFSYALESLRVHWRSQWWWDNLTEETLLISCWWSSQISFCFWSVSRFSSRSSFRAERDRGGEREYLCVVCRLTHRHDPRNTRNLDATILFLFSLNLRLFLFLFGTLEKDSSSPFCLFPLFLYFSVSLSGNFASLTSLLTYLTYFLFFSMSPLLLLLF